MRWTGRRYAIAILLVWIAGLGLRALLARQEVLGEYALICGPTGPGAEMPAHFRALVCSEQFTTARFQSKLLIFGLYSGLGLLVVGLAVWFLALRRRVSPQR